MLNSCQRLFRGGCHNPQTHVISLSFIGHEHNPILPHSYLVCYHHTLNQPPLLLVPPPLYLVLWDVSALGSYYRVYLSALCAGVLSNSWNKLIEHSYIPEYNQHCPQDFVWEIASMWLLSRPAFSSLVSFCSDSILRKMERCLSFLERWSTQHFVWGQPWYNVAYINDAVVDAW